MPELPSMDVGLSGQVKFAYSEEALRAYGEAVREACAKVAEAPQVRAFDPQDDAAAEQMNSLLQSYFAGVAAVIRKDTP